MSDEQQQGSPSSSCATCNNGVSSTTLIFTAALVKELSSPNVRLPPNYVGVRRVRPSSRGVAAKLLEGNNTVLVSSSNLVFKIKDENGKERRMNHQEKKELKQQLALEKKEAKKRSLAEMTAATTPSDSSLNANAANEEKDEKDSTSYTYHHLSVNPAALEQELAELRGERGGLPPVILSAPMVLQAQGVLPGTSKLIDNGSKECALMYDENLSKEWARVLKESMVPAERVRQQEDLRPMAYQLTPEPWTRMRPSNLSETKLDTSFRSTNLELGSRGNEKPSSVRIKKKCEWASATCWPRSMFSVDVSIVFEYLYRQTTFYVSCGAKFGSDFLIYDGPREERHAFAGMRVLSATKDGLPLLTAYSLAGYVRCLNTAGKLALLATVVHDQLDGKPFYRVALVDMALEKILNVPNHQRRARTQLRRDVTQNLAKK